MEALFRFGEKVILSTYAEENRFRRDVSRFLRLNEGSLFRPVE